MVGREFANDLIIFRGELVLRNARLYELHWATQKKKIMDKPFESRVKT